MQDNTVETDRTASDTREVPNSHVDHIGDGIGMTPRVECVGRQRLHVKPRIGLDDAVEEVEVVGVIQAVRDCGAHPCDEGIFVPQNQFEDGLHEWDIGEAHCADVLDSQCNKEIDK